jgi:hypothetical protein
VWRSPAFVGGDLVGRWWRRVYDDADPAVLVSEEEIPPGEPAEGPSDGVTDRVRCVEAELSRMLPPAG